MYSTSEEALSAFGGVAEQLLHDVQERLVFRAHMYLRTDVAEYNPSPGDLAYPEKLHLMQVMEKSVLCMVINHCDQTFTISLNVISC